MNKLTAAHVPVIHQGYLDFFNRHPDAPIGVFDQTITSQHDYLRKDIRMLDPEVAVRAIQGLGFRAFQLCYTDLLANLDDESTIISMPDDDLSRSLINQHPPQAQVTLEQIFLRWDRNNTTINSDVQPDRMVHASELSCDITTELYEAAQKSSDWWRHVGAGIIEDGKIITAYNRALPHEHITAIEGDPRATEKRGQAIETSLFIHAEADLIATMARTGESTLGRDLYVTTFPCPNCAKLIAASGFRACYFVEGYAMLDGQRVLHEGGVEVVQVVTDAKPETVPHRLKKYPEK